jgi:hypothetical protein
MAAEFDLNPRAPIFFVSYAHAALRKPIAGARERNGAVLRFFDDLSTHVSELVGSPTGADPGFLDRSMDGGKKWSPEVLQAAGTCQVFIPLISDPYLRSQWCAFEWHAFSRRRVVNRDRGSPDNETAMLPVTWSTTHIPVPRVVSSVQRFAPNNLEDLNINTRYQQEGIYGLLALHDDLAYQTVVWRLAQRVANLYHSHRVDPHVPSGPTELRDVFKEEEEE